MQHGGPPAALLAHVMAPGGDLRLTRVAVDFLGPIPRRECTVEVSPAEGEWVRLSCRIQLSGDGLGLAHGELHDTGGRLGVVTQPLLVRERR